MRTLKLEVKLKAMRITEAFEGGWLAGNYDGMILSWGPFQWNLGMGTLQPILRRIYELEPSTMQEHLGADFCASLDSNEALERFVRDTLLTPSGAARTAWQRRFYQLSQEDCAVQAFAEAAQPYVDRAVGAVLSLGFTTERAYALCFDACIQNGDVRADHRRLYLQNLHELLAKTGGSSIVYDLEEWQHLKCLAHAVADCANPRWHDDVLSRKLSLALGHGWVHGREYDYAEDFGLLYWQDRAAGIKAPWYE